MEACILASMLLDLQSTMQKIEVDGQKHGICWELNVQRRKVDSWSHG